MLQSLYDHVNDPSCVYDLVSWISLKTEHLTERGVAAITDGVLSLEQALPKVVEPLKTEFPSTIAQHSELLEGLRVLIVIDNIETVGGTEVLELVDGLPDTVDFLLTSRVGLGEGERRVPLGPLDEGAAIDLFRRLARVRHLDHFARMDRSLIQQVVTQLGRTPLGLRWFMAAVESGAEPSQVLAHRDELLEFCIGTVLSDTPDDVVLVAEVLYYLARPATAAELGLFLEGIPSDEIRAALQSLDRRFLVRKSFLEDSLTETFDLTESIVDYFRSKGTRAPSRADDIRTLEERHQRDEERHSRELEGDPLRPNVVHGGPQHRAAILMLRNALTVARTNGQRALALVDSAAAADPDFWEVYRVRGFILSTMRRASEASAAYETALQLAPDDLGVAVTKYFFAGHLARGGRDTQRAQHSSPEKLTKLLNPLNQPCSSDKC